MKSRFAKSLRAMPHRLLPMLVCVLVPLNLFGVPRAHGFDQKTELAKAALLDGDFAEAARLAELQTEARNEDSLMIMGLVYFLDFSPLHDLQSGLELLHHAADLGSAEASLVLALHYVDIGGDENLRVAQRLFNKSQTKFFGISAHGKALLLIQFKGRPGDIAKYTNIAYDSGASLSATSLAYLHSTGIGVSKDRNQAEVFMREDANRGYPASQYELGKMLLKGDCSRKAQPPNKATKYIEALRWLNLARLQDNEDAAYLVEECSELLDQSSLDQARIEANAWFVDAKANPLSLLSQAAEWCQALQARIEECEYVSINDDIDCFDVPNEIFPDTAFRSTKLYALCRQSLWQRRMN